MTCLLARIAFLGMLGIPLPAHHSFAADYDTSKPLRLQGTVTRIDWMNPHVHFYLDVKDESGQVTNWDFELGSPNTLIRSGWNRNTLKTGYEITVKGCRAKDYPNRGNATSILASDGTELLSGTAAGPHEIER